jgi:hypothetical protein
MTVPPRQPDSFSQNQNRKELSPAGLPLPFSGSSFDENMLWPPTNGDEKRF